MNEQWFKLEVKWNDNTESLLWFRRCDEMVANMVKVYYEQNTQVRHVTLTTVFLGR